MSRNPPTGAQPDYECIRAAPEGSAFPGRKALARLARGSALRVPPGDKVPAPERIPVTRRDTLGSPARPLPIVYGWVETAPGVAMGGADWFHPGHPRTMPIAPDDVARYVRNGWLPLPRVGEWIDPRYVRAGTDWQAATPAMTTITHEFGTIRCKRRDAGRVLAKLASSVKRSLFADAIMRRALRGADVLTLRRAA